MNLIHLSITFTDPIWHSPGHERLIKKIMGVACVQWPVPLDRSRVQKSLYSLTKIPQYHSHGPTHELAFVPSSNWRLIVFVFILYPTYISCLLKIKSMINHCWQKFTHVFSPVLLHYSSFSFHLYIKHLDYFRFKCTPQKRQGQMVCLLFFFKIIRALLVMMSHVWF